MTHDQNPDPTQSQFADRIESLATAIEERPPVDIEEAPQTRSSRHLYWLIGALCALTIGVAEVGILTRSTAPDAPPPPPAVLEAFEQDPCAARMGAIMVAIAAYTNAHGSPPPSLAVLNPNYLTVAPIDPVSNQPYGYQVIGESVSLFCPSAELAPDAAPAPLTSRPVGA